MAKKSSEINIFLSWSGSMSKKLAEVLRDWLPLVHHYTFGEKFRDGVARIKKTPEEIEVNFSV